MKIKIISELNQKLKYVDPNFDTESIDKDDYEKGIAIFKFEGSDNELMESGEDFDGSAELWGVYERIEKFAEVFNIDWETCEFIGDSGENWAEN